MSKIPDLIISDIMMPVKDGFTCCRELREQPRTAHIPILMLTAKAEDADVLQASKIGVDDYMMKPFNPEVLKAKVRNLILQRERLKRIYTKTLMLKQQESEPETDGNNAPDDFIQQIIHVIEANLANENFNVKMLADQLNMSQPTLYRKIKQRSELAAIDMIRSVRMGKAASLIMENRYSIQEIAEMVGYSDTRTLRKHFTEQFGVSPSKYMERNESASYPKQIPIRLPCTIRSWFSLTSFNLPATSFREMEPISAPCRETIRPNCPEAISSVACPPIRVARLRS